MAVAWRALAPTFGAEITELDITRPLSPEIAQELRDLWHERGLLRFRGQSLSTPQYLDFARNFGALEVHPSVESHAEGFPELLRMRYDPAHRERTVIYEVDGEELANWQPWHIDMIYTTRMDHGGLLQGVIIPPYGANTGFIDRIGLLESLPPHLRARIEGKRVIYQIEPCFDKVRFLPFKARIVNKPGMLTRLEERRATDMPPVSHPAILRHPITGVENLAISPTHAIGFVDMDPEESDLLLSEVVAHIVGYSGRFYQEWQTGDIVVWDNWRFVHSAGGTPTAHARCLFRAGIKGDYSEGRVHAQGSAPVREWVSAV
jgi:taurine dioxygenase